MFLHGTCLGRASEASGNGNGNSNGDIVENMHVKLVTQELLLKTSTRQLQYKCRFSAGACKKS